MQVALKAVFYPVALVATEIGMAGFNAIAVLFGIDQLPASSADQLAGFMTWVVFTIPVKWGLVFPFSCPMMKAPHNVLLQVLFQAVLLSAALMLDSFFRDWLIIEPQTSNLWLEF